MMTTWNYVMHRLYFQNSRHLFCLSLSFFDATIPSQICQAYDVNSLTPLSLFYEFIVGNSRSIIPYLEWFFVISNVMPNIAQLTVLKQHKRDEFARHVSVHAKFEKIIYFKKFGKLDFDFSSKYSFFSSE